MISRKQSRCVSHLEIRIAVSSFRALTCLSEKSVQNEENGIGNGFTAEIWQSAGNVSSSMLLTAAAMPLTSLALDAPPSPLDEGF